MRQEAVEELSGFRGSTGSYRLGGRGERFADENGREAKSIISFRKWRKRERQDSASGKRFPRVLQLKGGNLIPGDRYNGRLGVILYPYL